VDDLCQNHLMRRLDDSCDDFVLYSSHWT